MTSSALRRGQRVLIDTDLRFGGRVLRGLRGRIFRLGHAGSAFVCTCGGDDLHASNCPVTLPLARGEVIRADAGTATTAAVLLTCLLGGLLFLTAVAYGQQAMCHLHDQSLRYCPGHTATTSEEPRP